MLLISIESQRSFCCMTIPRRARLVGLAPALHDGVPHFPSHWAVTQILFVRLTIVFFLGPICGSLKWDESYCNRDASALPKLTAYWSEENTALGGFMFANVVAGGGCKYLRSVFPRVNSDKGSTPTSSYTAQLRTFRIPHPGAMFCNLRI